MPLPSRSLRTSAIAAVALAAVAAAGCGGGGAARAPNGPGSGRPPVVLGSQNFTEQRILGELYAQALRAKGYRVRIRGDLPDRSAAARALTDGRIDGYPEYMAAILGAGAPGVRFNSLGAARRALQRLESRRGFSALTPTPYARTEALGVTAAYARRRALTDIGGLARVGRLTLGAVPDFETRPTGLPALRRAYRFTDVEFRPLGSGGAYAALDAGRVQVAVVKTTDAVLRTGRYVVLADPRHAFGIGNAVPVLSRAVVAAEGPAFASTLDAVSAKLTLGAIRTMNAGVEVDKRTPADVARGFLRTNGLL